MRKIFGGLSVLAAVVATFVLVTSFGSPAQEETQEPADSTTTSTVADHDDGSRGTLEFDFGPDGLSEAIDDFLTCLENEGIAVPGETERGFRFEFGPGDEALPEALEQCGLPGRPFFDELPDRPQFGEGFFGFGFGEGFPDGLPFGERFFEEFDGMRFPGPRWHGPIDRDALAECLAELGSFDSVEAVREQLDECLPEASFGGFLDFDLELEEPFPTTTTTIVPPPVTNTTPAPDGSTPTTTSTVP